MIEFIRKHKFEIGYLFGVITTLMIVYLELQG